MFTCRTFGVCSNTLLKEDKVCVVLVLPKLRDVALSGQTAIKPLHL